MKITKRIQGLFVRGTFGKVLNNISFKKYMRCTISYYKNLGVNLSEKCNYINPTCYIDSHNYRLITIGKDVTISMNVILLCHDYSISNALHSIGYEWEKGTPHFEKEIVIGDNSFIGANALLLPGTYIGKNCIIGGGAVVKGVFEDNSIIVGNPAKVIANTLEWAERKKEVKDWGLE